MSERVQAQTKNSATPSMAAQPSSSQYQRPFTDERYEPIARDSTRATDGKGIQAKTIRTGFNWQNISVEAPNRSGANIFPSSIQRQEEEQEQQDIQMKQDATIQRQETADSEEESPIDLAAKSNSTRSIDGSVTQPKIAFGGFNLANMSIFPPAKSVASQPLSGGIQRQQAEDRKEQEDATDLQMQPDGAIQLKCSECEKEEKQDNINLKPESETKEGQNLTGEEEQDQNQSIQTKLTVGAPGDKYEQEADSMAAKVMTMPDSAVQQPIQRTEEREKEEIQPSPLANSIEREKEEIQPSPLANSITPLMQRQTAEDAEALQMKPGLQRATDGSSQASGSVENRLAGSKGGGSALPDDTRSFMEPRFGADLSSIKVHTDSNAVQMNKELGAQAFAHGSDIYYGAGKSPGKNELTAHELTHTIQQGGAVRTKSVTQQEKKENKLQAKADAIQLTALEPKIQRKEDPQAQPAAAKVAAPAPQNAAASPAAKSEKGEPANTIEKPIAGGAAGAPSAPAGNSGGGGAGASSGGAAGGGAGGGGGNSPDSAQNDPGFKAVVNSTKTVATQEKNHPPAGTKSAAAQAAAVAPANEVESKAQDKQVQEMNQQQPGQFNAGAFKAALMEKISAATPKNLEEADNFKDQNQLDSVKGDLSSQVGDEKKQAVDPIEEKTKEQPDPSGITPKPVTPLPPKQAGEAPSDIGADKAAPKPKSESEVSLQEGSKSIDKQMADADITEPQLANSNEPQFQSALETKKTAQTHANTAPNAYRQQEQGILTQAQGQAQITAQANLQGMHGGREQVLTGVAGLQVDTKGQDEQKRGEVANHIQGIYNNTKQKVETTLSQLDGEVTQQFDQGASAAKTEFENYVDQRMKRYKEKRYSGFFGPAKWLWDKLFGMPSEVNTFYEEGKNKFLASMDKTIDNIANHVAKTLNTAKNEIAKGKQQISKYVAGLDPSLKQVGQQAAQEIQGKFDELEQSVDSKQDELIDNLAQKYKENLQQIDARINQMKEENKGLVQKAIDFVVGVVKTIVEFAKMLAQILAKAISAIPAILKDPIGFLGNLVTGLKQGFEGFMANIEKHLQSGMLGWLTGTLGSAGIQMPESLDAKGTFSLVTQVLGLGYETIRAKATKRVGEKAVNNLESSFEMFVVLKNEGVGGLWKFIQDRIGDLKSMVMDTIQSFVIETVIKQGIMWILSLLNPASAFVRACKAIIDIVTFFIERGSQIIELVNAVIDAVIQIANGAVGGAAKAIENALAKAIPVVIGFMASLLGLGGITDKIQGIMKKARQPIEKAINWVMEQAVKFAKKSGRNDGGKDKNNKAQDRNDVDKDKNNKAQDRNDGVQDKNNKAQDRNDGVQDKNNKAQDRNDGVQDKNNKAQDRNDGDKDKNNKAQDRNDGDKDKNNKAQDRNDGAQDKNNKAQDRNDGDKDKNNQAQDRNDRGKDNNDNAQDNDDWWNVKQKLTATDGEQHTLFFSGKRERAKLMIASIKRTYEDLIKDVDVDTPGTPPEKKKAKTEAKPIADKIDELTSKRAGKGRGVQNPKGRAIKDQVIKELNKLAEPTRILADETPTEPPSVVKYGNLTSEGGATWMDATVLSKNHVKGSEPSDKPPIWEKAQRRKNHDYVRGHLLNENIGGPGAAQNLSPITNDANKQHLKFVEKDAKKAVLKEGKVIRYRVEVKYNKHPNRSSQTAIEDRLKNSTSTDPIKDNMKLEIMKYEQEKLPRAFENEWAILKYQGGKWVDDKVKERISILSNLPDKEPEI